MRIISPFALAAALAVSLSGAAMAQVDESAAMDLAKKSKCTKCHAADKKKDGPAYKETAAKYKGKADAEDKIFKHITTGPKIKVDGKEEEHEKAKGSDAEIKNLVKYILSR